MVRIIDIVVVIVPGILTSIVVVILIGIGSDKP